jgi:hypothetical protein
MAAETGTTGLAIYLFFVIAILVAGGNAARRICTTHQQARQQLPRTRERILAPGSTPDKLILLTHPARFLQHYRPQQRFETFGQLTNDRALAIGLMAAIITVCVHNLVDDLYDHSLTNLLALLLISLIRLGTITSQEPVESRQGSRSSTVGVSQEHITKHVGVTTRVYPER